MRQLEALVREAQAEASRQLQICNACRYCEGFCAVFPAMTRRLEFGPGDVHYLANLCHNCGACLHACQYAPPHDFAVNVPRAMAQVRVLTYSHYAWPAPLGALYRRNGPAVALALVGARALFLVLLLGLRGSIWNEPLAGDFYQIFPHRLMVGLFAPVFVFALLALGIGVRRFWRDQSPGAADAAALAEASSAVLRLRYLGGGHGDGCNEDSDAFTHARRRAHHLTFYGFMACFAATVVATFFHYLGGWPAPYPYTALPKLLGIAGGLSLAAGTAWLWRLHLRRAPAHGDPAQRPMDLGFIALLFLAASTGLLLTALRGTSALGLLLCVHLATVLALFLMLPYGKFAHGVYRGAALLKWAIEKRRPNTLGMGE
jgi:citrate/tricarballylate utilization protein